MNLGYLLSRHAVHRPDAVAVSVGDQDYANYREFAARAGSLAQGMRATLGIQEGDRVAIFLENCPQYLEVLFACWFAGAVAVPINVKLHGKELGYILDLCGARAVFVGDAGAPALEEAFKHCSVQMAAIALTGADYQRLCAVEPMAPLPIKSDALAWLFFTSGTTGRPKGAMLSHRNLLAMAYSYWVDIDPVSQHDGLLHVAPMSHGSGLYAVPFMLVAARHILPESKGFDAAETHWLLKRHQKVSLFAAPTMVRRLIDVCDELAPPGLKRLVYGGAPMYRQDCLEAIAILGDRLAQIYGQGESPMTITALPSAAHIDRNHPRYLSRLASVGVPRTGVEVAVVGPDGVPLPFGETGEVTVRGDTVMQGYWQDAGATSAALRDGWLFTGDIGAIDVDGYLSLKDRSKDLIISGGSNIYPREIEEVLLTHPAVAEVAVVGKPNLEWGEEVVAIVVFNPGQHADIEALDQLCLDNIARFKRPKAYVFASALPKNNYGKVLKTALRQELQTGRINIQTAPQNRL